MIELLKEEQMKLDVKIEGKVIDSTVELPDPPVKEKNVATRDAYMRCLARLPFALGNEMPAVVRCLYKEEPKVALRFIGEMEIAGYLKFIKGSRMEDVKEKGKRIRKRVKYTEVHGTKKLDDIPIEAFIEGEKNSIRYPVKFWKAPKSEVRRGVNKNSTTHKQNPESYDIWKDIGKEKFIINEFILDVLEDQPAMATDANAAKWYRYYEDNNVDTTRMKGNLTKRGGHEMYKLAIRLAHEYKNWEYFMFPTYLDSRGRGYDATTVGFSPQGADHEKAMILPYNKEVLTVEGYQRLVDTALDYAEQDWSVDDMITHATYYDVMKHEWLKADKPYQYLACADLIRQYNEDPNKPLPAFTPRDARCSGLQHWTAITGSTSIADRIGMMPEEADDGQDIYEFVGIDWTRREPELAYLYSRKLFKIPVMTFCYRATPTTTMKHLRKLHPKLSNEEIGSIGMSIYNSLHETLGDFTEAVKWLGESAAACVGKRRTKLNWTLPDGFVAQQTKCIEMIKHLSVTLSNGKRVQVDVQEESQKSNPKAHETASCANLIHSFDACHLRMVARRMMEEGMSMIFVHDSFSTHSNDTDRMYNIIIEEFVKLYSRNVLLDLKDEWEGVYKVELNDPPKMGDWDVNILRKCGRFFT